MVCLQEQAFIMARSKKLVLVFTGHKLEADLGLESNLSHGLFGLNIFLASCDC